MSQAITNSCSEEILQEINSFEVPFEEYSECFGRTEWTNCAGQSGVYFRINKCGAKVFRKNGDIHKVKTYKTREAVFSSVDWQNALKESENLRFVEGCGFTPKAYSVQPVKCGAGWLPALFMEHISGTELYYAKINKQTYKKIQDLLNILSEEYGVELEDHHGHNVIINQDKIFIIDFGCDFTKRFTVY